MSTSVAKLQQHLTKQSAIHSTSLRERLALQKQSREGNILLLDISGSMGEPVEGNWTKIDALWQIVQDLRSQNIQFKTAEFNDDCRWSDSITKPTPSGGTWLSGALEFIGRVQPTQITIVTDGEPHDPDMALVKAAELVERVSCKINVMYVGPSNARAESFCTLLAHHSNGQYAKNSMTTEVLQLQASQTVRALIDESSQASKPTINL
jgi:hypothetical protein